jgi:hypothetical protein
VPRSAAVLVINMRISFVSPSSPAPFRIRRSSYLFHRAGKPTLSRNALVARLQTIPVGVWVCADLDAIPGSTPTAKKLAASRAAKRFFTPVQAQVEGSRVFIRRVPEPETEILPLLEARPRAFPRHQSDDCVPMK